MSMLEILNEPREQNVEIPDLPLYARPKVQEPRADGIYNNPADDPEVLRAWGGEKLQCVCLSATAFAILLLLAPINENFAPKFLKMADEMWGDKVAHLILFSSLTGLYCCVFLPFCKTPARTFEYITPSRLGLVVGSIVFLAVATEFLQPLFGRDFDWIDMFVDVIAIVPGFGVFLVLNELRHKVVASRGL